MNTTKRQQSWKDRNIFVWPRDQRRKSKSLKTLFGKDFMYLNSHWKCKISKGREYLIIRVLSLSSHLSLRKDHSLSSSLLKLRLTLKSLILFSMRSRLFKRLSLKISSVFSKFKNKHLECPQNLNFERHECVRAN